MSNREFAVYKPTDTDQDYMCRYEGYDRARDMRYNCVGKVPYKHYIGPLYNVQMKFTTANNK